MPSTTTPDTLSVAQAIVSYGQGLVDNNNIQIYAQVQMGEIRDVTNVLLAGNACLEIYANQDDSQHFAFGGKIRDEQTWFLLSLVSLDDAQAAEIHIYQIRDALVRPFQIHATLGAIGSVYHAQIKANSGKFIKIFRNGQWFRAHLIEVMTRQEWYVPTPPGVIA